MYDVCLHCDGVMKDGTHKRTLIRTGMRVVTHYYLHEHI